MAETSNPQADGAAPDPERPGAGRTWRIGKYEILRELGRGAMGQVYEARHPVMGKTVAIKVFRAGSDLSAEEIEHNRQRLIDEGRRAGALSHPHIVTIHDVDVDVHGDLAYVVMEFVAGPSLEEWLKERGTVDPAVAVGLLQQVAGALDYAHSKGIIHRDIKPANILIAEGNQAKVADFGIAKSLTESTYTKTGTVLGTPFYMSPEQIVGTTLDGRSDQFSLGVIAYRMLAGHRPFDAESITSLLYKIVHEEPPSPATFNPKLSPASVSVLARALAKQPERRYASCTEFAASLQRAVAGESGFGEALGHGSGRDHRALGAAAPECAVLRPGARAHSGAWAGDLCFG
jgi:serine/threonine-protein kinase